MFRRHPVLSVLTLAYLAVVGWLTLGPQPLDGDGDRALRAIVAQLQGLGPTRWVTYAGIEFTANVLMFVPIGLFFLLLLGRRLWWLGILLGVLLTCGVELAQLFLPDRVSDPRDLVSNSLGAVIGTGAALLWTWPDARRDAARRDSGRRRRSPRDQARDGPGEPRAASRV